MKRYILILILFQFFLASCGVKEETVKLSITQTAMVTAQAELNQKLFELTNLVTQEAADFASSMDKTQEAYSSNLMSTQEMLKEMEIDLAGTQVAQAATSTFQVSIIATQQAINEEEIEKDKILEAAAEARLNPQVEGIDPVLDEFLLTTDVSIGQENFEFKGIRYSEQQVLGLNIASRFMYYDFSESEYYYVRIMAGNDKTKFPYDYWQVLNDKETGAWTRVSVNQQPYFYKSKWSGSEVAAFVDMGDGCSVVVVVNDDSFSDVVYSWIDYLVDTRLLLLSTDLPLCEGT